ncbi:MAG: tyrosine-type recombinase/integrase [Deltaproteobacteria bacterium]|nr:tyrosine-type recombinase/integrase [Deltaproteobacteria bacterium]
MEIRWNGKRETQRSYLSELLDVVNGTGRRISAVCALMYQDPRLDQDAHGAIVWPTQTDKMGRETVVPIAPAVRGALERILRERSGIGAAPLFPSPNDPGQPMTRHLADKWLRQAEKIAGVEPQRGSLRHAYRRKWANERKHLPDIDVAAAGGWKTAQTLRDFYQQADAETMLRVVLEAGDELREA